MKKITLSILLLLAVIALQAQQLTVASYNIRNNNSNDTKQGNGWAQRGPVIANQVSFNDFEIWGAQEVLHDQLLDLLASLPQYGYIGVGRDDGQTKGEYSPIFFKKDRIELIKNGQFWLSEETDYPNKGWDAVFPRIIHGGYFKAKRTKNKFWFLNQHRA